ncbi:MAG: CatB-related O-acetyltransferase [Opitutaceae bacterium]
MNRSDRIDEVRRSSPTDPELRRCRFSSVLVRSAAGASRRPLAIRLAFKFEGGEFYSATAREILRRFCGVEIGAYSYGGCFQLGAFPPGVKIGRYVSIGPEVLVYRRNHPLDWLSTHPFFYNPKLGVVKSEHVPLRSLVIADDVWIGARAIITPGCTQIGLGSAVAAGAVVTRDVPEFALVGGVPARIIRARFSKDLCDRIKASEWWKLPVSRCASCLEYMTRPLGMGEHPLISCAPIGSSRSA